jgi:peptidoglycan/LPS O-acetylase OafA/YrhL
VSAGRPFVLGSQAVRENQHPSPVAAAPGRIPRLDSIEVCRGIAATMVLTSHSAVILGAPANFGVSPFGQFFHFGRSGVDFFFVLSGFLISLLHWKDVGQPARLRRYAGRRLTRIYPTYWLVLIPIMPFDIFTHTLFDDYGSTAEVLKSIFLLPQDHTILDVTWSLRNELLFYVLFGLIILNRRIGLVIAGLWTVALVIRPFVVGAIANPWLDVLTYPMNVEFLIGVAAGWLFPRAEIARPGSLLGFGLVVFGALWFAEDRLWLTHLPWDRFFMVCLAYGLAAAAVIAGLSSLEQRGRVRMPRGLVALGGASYLLYLIHVPALLILGASERILHPTRFAPAWLLAGGFILIVIGGAMVAHRIIEKPLLRAIRRPTDTGPVALDRPMI